MEEYKTNEIVILIDATYLDKETGAFSEFFSHEALGRPLPQADIPLFLEAVAMDIGVKAGEHKLQVIWIYDQAQPILQHWTPSNLKEELNQVAFHSHLGEFSMNSWHNENKFITPSEFYNEVIRAIVSSKGIRKIALIGTTARLTEMQDSLKETDDCTVYLFSMQPHHENIPHIKQCQIGFPLLKALQVKTDEI
ncbi:MAG: hypothetical protein IJ417_03070 [Bacteroidaceae bacterium]|nr:hypothetical protein [Bacteroidaceae bacterium]